MSNDSATNPYMSAAGEPECKLAVRIAQRIEQEIIEKGWQVGTTIGSEMELAGRYGVSRAVMREAISIAEHDGLIVSRRGRQGGLWVATPAIEAVKTSLRNYLYYASVDIRDVLAARLVLENLMIEQASPHLNEEVYTLAMSLSDIDAAGFAATLRQQGALLRQLLELCDNPALSVFLLALIDLIFGLLFRRGLPAEDLRRFSEHSARLRQDYVRHMYGGDLIQARQSLHRLVEVGNETLRREVEANQFAESYPLRVALDLVMSPEELPLPVKGAEQLTHWIHREIERLDWREGASLGTEQELQKRFNVGRGVLREAIRPLERLGIVVMRTHIGLVIGRPDPAATIRSAALYLDHAGLSAASARLVQNELELAGIGQLASASATLRANCVRELEAEEQNYASQADPQERRMAVRRLYFCLVKNLPSQVISLFLGILAEISYSNMDFAVAAAYPGEFWNDIHAIQQRLTQAIADGDETQARRTILSLQTTRQAIPAAPQA